jgi:hypothetical protein
MASYEYEQHRTFKLDEEGERIQLANFTARIVRETRLVDGINTETTLTIGGQLANPSNGGKGIDLPEVDVAAASFAGMGWVMPAWGVRALIFPGMGVKEDLRTAIQLNSRPEICTIYKAIGWTEIEGKPAYLHGGGAMTAKGNDPNVSVRLPVELSRYNLETVVPGKDGFHASLHLTLLGPEEVAWPLWSATFAPLFGAIDFGMHLTGRSGTFKSELISLFQSHYGPGMDARHLPGSWSSTANALEAQAYYAASAPFTIDDFVPVGTSWQVRAYQTTADKIIRSQGNQSGRARLTDTSSLQTAYYPRGIILSTGEDTPEGHSVRARMMIMELSPGDVKPDLLSKCQAERKKYVGCIAELVKDLCKTKRDITDRSEAIRNENIEVGHTRTPPMIGRLIAVAEAVLQWAWEKKYIDEKAFKKLFDKAKAAILKAGQNQQTYLETADPVEIFKAALRQVLGAHTGHIRTLNGGIPKNAAMLGWSEENNHSDFPTYKSHGPCIGWIDWNADEMYVEVNTGYNAIKKVAGQELAITKQTLFKRMADAGALVRKDEARQRNTVRITAEAHGRQVVVLSIAAALETQEVPQDEQGTLDPLDIVHGDAYEG